MVAGAEADADTDARAVCARAIEKTLGGAPFQVMDWYELNRAVFPSKP